MVYSFPRLKYLLLRFLQALGGKLPMDSIYTSESRSLQAALGDPPVQGFNKHVEDEKGKSRVLGIMPTVPLQNNFRLRF